MAKPTFIFDTSPLLTLAVSLVDKTSVLDVIVSHLNICVVQAVAQEATYNPTYRDAIVVQRLLDSRSISHLPAPTTPLDLILDAYTNIGSRKDQGKGERDTIRLGIAIRERVVIDDQAAFFLAARFELQPIALLDLIVELVRAQHIHEAFALKIVTSLAISGRYSIAAIEHTGYKINEVTK